MFPRLALFALALCGVLTAGLVTLTRAQVQEENQPGRPTTARMYILNSGAAQAVPVAVHSTGDVIPVTWVGTPAVTLANPPILTVRLTRQTWEYRTLTVPGGRDVAAALNEAGSEGWEAVSVTTSSGGSTAILKRLR